MTCGQETEQRASERNCSCTDLVETRSSCSNHRTVCRPHLKEFLSITLRDRAMSLISGLGPPRQAGEAIRKLSRNQQPKETRRAWISANPWQLKQGTSLSLNQWFSECRPWPVALTSPGNMLQVKISDPTLDLVNQRFWGLGGEGLVASNLCFNRSHR